MIVVQDQIRDILDRETSKITFRRIKYKFRPSSNKNSRFVQYIGTLEGAVFRVVKFLKVFVLRRDLAYS